MSSERQNLLDFEDPDSTSRKGLQVVTASFRGVEPFSWSLFDGFETMRALTYSVSTPMILRMLERHGFRLFECVFGYEAGLGRFANVIAFQQFLVTQLREAALKLKDERQRAILEKIHAGEAEFYVVRENVAHSKLYLLEGGEQPRRRVITGSANLSERAFSGKQPETLLVFDDDEAAPGTTTPASTTR